MTGAELRKLRERSGLSAVKFGVAIGFGGKRHNIARAVRRLEGSDALGLDVVANAARFEASLFGRGEAARRAREGHGQGEAQDCCRKATEGRQARRKATCERKAEGGC